MNGLYKRDKEAEKAAKNYSIIHWQTGEPKESGTYLVTNIEGSVGFSYYEADHYIDKKYFRTCITAWCKLSDIEPYKEE